MTQKLTVIVTEDRWDAFGDFTSAFKYFKSIRLITILKSLGGINESVTPGTYHFYVTRKFFTFTSHLDKID